VATSKLVGYSCIFFFPFSLFSSFYSFTLDFLAVFLIEIDGRHVVKKMALWKLAAGEGTGKTSCQESNNVM
jgi:hypothetical protein